MKEAELSNGALAIIFGGAVAVAGLIGLIQILPLGRTAKNALGLSVTIGAVMLSVHLFRAIR